MALNQCGISIFTPTEEIFTRHNSIQSWHLVIAIKHEGHPFYYFFFCTNYLNITLFTLKKSSVIWFDLHIPHLTSPVSQTTHHITHTVTTRIYQELDLTPTQSLESPLPRVSSLSWKFLKKENQHSSLFPSIPLPHFITRSARQTLHLSPSKVTKKEFPDGHLRCYTQESGDPGYCSAL